MGNRELYYGVIGGGFWAKNLIKSLRSSKLFVTGFYDLDESIEIEHVVKYKDKQELIDNSDVVCVATPPSSHFFLAKKVIESKTHCFIEKPFCATYDESCELLALAKKNNVNIHVDLTWIYHQDFSLIRDLIHMDRFGKEKFAKFNWQSFGKFQDIGNIKDLAIHPLSLAIKLWGVPKYVLSNGYFNKKTNEASEIVLTYMRGLDDFFKVYISSSWWSPKKIRSLSITTDNGVLETDFTGQVDFIDFSGQKQILRSTNLGSPLEVQFIHLQNRWSDNKITWTDGKFGAELMYLLEKIEKSCYNGGKEEMI